MPSLDAGEFVHPGFAQLDKPVDAGKAVAWCQFFDIFLAFEAQFLFDLHLHPQALAIETVLVAQVAAFHGMVTLEGVFIGAPPGMVHAHGIIGGDGAVEE